MYLYEKKDNKMYVYELEPNYDKVRAYQKKEMNDNPATFFKAEADASTPNKILEKNDFIDIKDLNVPNTNPIMFSSVNAYNNRFHSFKTDSINESILNCYLVGAYDENRVVAVYKNGTSRFDNFLNMMDVRGIGIEGNINNKSFIYNCDNEKSMVYYLLITSSYEREPFSSHVCMSNIVSIPQSLYLLQLLLQGRFHNLDENIDEQLSLFDFKFYPIEVIPFEYIESMSKYGLIDNSTSMIDEKLKDSEKILKKLR